jgi:hypothetical protein
MKNKELIKKGFYPISYKKLIKKVNICEKWGYGNKDTCKYVAETTIEEIELKYPDLPIKDTLYGVLIGIAHDLNKGRRYTDELEISIVD